MGGNQPHPAGAFFTSNGYITTTFGAKVPDVRRESVPAVWLVTYRARPGLLLSGPGTFNKMAQERGQGHRTFLGVCDV